MPWIPALDLVLSAIGLYVTWLLLRLPDDYSRTPIASTTMADVPDVSLDWKGLV